MSSEREKVRNVALISKAIASTPIGTTVDGIIGFIEGRHGRILSIKCVTDICDELVEWKIASKHTMENGTHYYYR